MNHQASIEIQGLSTGYITSKRRIVIADKIDATIRAGELTCLLGANGAGKSTLLRTLSGFQPPLGGEIRLMGRPLGEYSDKRLSRVIGVVLTGIVISRGSNYASDIVKRIGGILGKA